MTCERGGQRRRGLQVHGHLDIVPPGTPSIWEPEEEDSALILSLNPVLLRKAAEELGHDPEAVEIRNRFQIRDPQIESIAWAMKSEMETGFAGGEAFADSMGLAIAVCLVLRHSSVTEPSETLTGGMSGKKLREALSYIEDNLGSPLPLAAIAQAANLSVSRFNASFRQAMGISAHRHVLQRRLERAKALLTETKLSIRDVAEQTGFAHQSHLAAQVRRMFGRSPKEIRDAAQ